MPAVACMQTIGVALPWLVGGQRCLALGRGHKQGLGQWREGGRAGGRASPGHQGQQEQGEHRAHLGCLQEAVLKFLKRGCEARALGKQERLWKVEAGTACALRQRSCSTLRHAAGCRNTLLASLPLI